MDWKDIEAQLCTRVEDVCRHLFPQGKRDGAEFVIGDLSGGEGQSLKINLTGKLGVWRDFAGDHGGKTLCSLWLHARALPTFGAAMREIKEWLGIRDDFRPGQKIRQAPAPQQSHEPADDSGWKQVAEIWAKCEPLTEGGPCWNYLATTRGIDPAVLSVFGVREYLTHGKWALVFPYFAVPDPEAVSIKLGPEIPVWLKFEALERVDGKKKEWTTKAPEKSLFGVQLAGHPFFKKVQHVLLCEGEKDALTWAHYGCHAWGVLPVSVPFGAKWKGQDKTRPSPNREWLDRSWDWLQEFATVIVAMDGDEAGKRAAVDIIAEIGPRRCRMVELPEGHKDANDCLKAGIAPEAMKAAIDAAKDFAPEKVIAATDLEDEFIKWVFDREMEEGIETPFAFPLRFRRGETTLWLGIEKSGKTTVLSFCSVAAMMQGERCLVASFEVPWPDSHTKLARQAYGGLFYDKRVIERIENESLDVASAAEARTAYREKAKDQARTAHRWLAPQLWYYDHVGIGNWQHLAEDIRWARHRLGITWVVIDNFMRLGIPKDDYAQQADAIIRLVALGMELGLHLHIVLHQNKSEGTKGGASGKRSASGAHELLGNPHNIVEVQRDDKKALQVSELYEKRKLGMIGDAEFRAEKESLDLRGDGKFILRAQRNGETNDASKMLWFLWESQQYADRPPGHADHGPIKFVKAESAKRELPSEGL